jgi:GTP-binding protein EngB required for normal cell division
MSTMNSTGAWTVPARALEASLGDLKQWRQSTASSLCAFRRWATVARMLDEQDSARLAHLERRLAGERLTIAFVGESSRGKSELINALFFADLGVRLLPSGAGRTTLCPTEILWDPTRPPSIRLLPIDTRLDPKALREYIAGSETWKEIALDPTRPETLAAACEVISEVIPVPGNVAADLGFAAESPARVEIPRWRYAIVNFPHPLLQSGVAVLDTPGHNTLGSEPELSVHRVPDAAAIVFMLAADSGATRADRDLWIEHIAPIHGVEQTCFVVLNKIDGLRDGLKSEAHVLSEIDRQVRSTADALGVAPTRIFALSAKQALVARIQGDRDALLKSRLYRLEQALARDMVHARRLDHATAVRAEMRPIFAQMRTLVASRLGFAQDQLEEIAALQGKNQKLVEALAKKASAERGRLEQARAMMLGLRTVHNRHSDELARLLDPNAARMAGIQARKAVLSTAFSRGIGDALDGFFHESRQRIRKAVDIIEEAKTMMVTVSRRFAEDYRIAGVEAVPFGTERFLIELDRLEESCTRNFKGTSSLILHRRATLGGLFFDTVALKVIHIFEIADREVRAWMNGFVRPLDAQINTYQEQANARIEGMGRIQDAEADLMERLGELRTIARDMAAQRDELEAHHAQVTALLELEREPSLA